MALLVAICGLPASGKSTLASLVARALELPLFELDRLEAPLLKQGITGDQIGWAGYGMLTALADLNLRIGQGVVLDSVAWTNRVRAAWADLAKVHDARFRPIQMICSDPSVQLRRMQGRWPDAASGALAAQMERSRALYEPWNLSCLTLDSALDVEQLRTRALDYIRE